MMEDWTEPIKARLEAASDDSRHNATRKDPGTGKRYGELPYEQWKANDEMQRCCVSDIRNLLAEREVLRALLSDLDDCINSTRLQQETNHFLVTMICARNPSEAILDALAWQPEEGS